MTFRFAALFIAAAALLGRVATNAADGDNNGHGSTPVLVEHFPEEGAGGADPSAAVIFLHGLGDTGRGWQRTARRLAKQLPHVKFILPTAPRRPVTVNGGSVGYAWYDIAQLPGRRRTAGASQQQSQDHDIDGIMASADEVERLIAVEAEALGIPRSRVVVGGFSQGATVSLVTGLRSTAAQSDELLAGIVSLSGYLAGGDSFDTWGHPTAINELPVLQCHGRDDPVVPFTAAEQSHSRLRELGATTSNLHFEAFDGLKHSVNQEVLQKVYNFLRRHLPPIATDNREDL